MPTSLSQHPQTQIPNTPLPARHRPIAPLTLILRLLAAILALLAFAETIFWSLHPLRANGGLSHSGRNAAWLAIASALAALASWFAARPRHAWLVFVRFFAARSHPVNLAVFRIILFAVMLWQVCAQPPWFWTRVPSDFLAPPLGMGALAPWLLEHPAATNVAGLLLIAACCTGVLGLFSRTSALAAALLSWCVLGLPQSFGAVSHNHHLIWFALLLSVSPCGDALAIDRHLRRRHRPSLPCPSRAHALPIRFAWLLIATLFFFPGLWKLASVGLDWTSADNLRAIGHQLTAQAYAPPSWITDHINSTILCLSGMAVILFEMGFVFLVFNSRRRAWLALAGLLFHNGAGLVIHIWFFFLQPFYAIFIDWNCVIRRVQQRFDYAAFDRPPMQHQLLPSAKSLPAPAPGWPIALVGAALLAVNAAMGITGIYRAWPFACYPTFAVRNNDFVVRMEVGQVGPDGIERALPLDRLKILGHWNRLSDQVLAVADPVRRQSELAALRTVLTMEGINLDPAATLRFYRVTLHTAQPPGSPAFSSREFFGAVGALQPHVVTH